MGTDYARCTVLYYTYLFLLFLCGVCSIHRQFYFVVIACINSYFVSGFVGCIPNLMHVCTETLDCTAEYAGDAVLGLLIVPPMAYWFVNVTWSMHEPTS